MTAGSRFTIKTKEMIIEPVDEGNIWEGDWTITLREDKPVQIGTASFAGDKLLGAVPICVTLSEQYRNRDYGTEVYKLMVEFAFGFKNIYEVTAVTDSDNDKCVHALEKAGFVRRKKEGKTETYSVIKPNSTWMGLYLYIGIIAGLVLGIVVGTLWVGMVIGVVLGVMIGAVMDTGAKKEREKVTGRKD